MERRFWVGQEDEFKILDAHGRPAGTIAGCILTISEDKGDGRYAMVDTGKEVRTVRLK